MTKLSTPVKTKTFNTDKKLKQNNVISTNEPIVLEEFNLIVDQELKDCLPEQTKDTIIRLRDSIKLEGCKMPIEVWKTPEGNKIIDGMTRYSICEELNIKPKIIFKEFNDKFEVKEYMVKNQLARRNITAYQRSLVILNLKEGYTKIAKEKLKKAGSIGGKSNAKGSSIVNNPLEEEEFHVMKILAEQAGVSANFLRDVSRISEKATPQEKSMLDNDEYSVSGLAKIIKERDKPSVPKKPKTDTPKIEDGTQSQGFEEPERTVTAGDITRQNSDNKLVPAIDTDTVPNTQDSNKEAEIQGNDNNKTSGLDNQSLDEPEIEDNVCPDDTSDNPLFDELRQNLIKVCSDLSSQNDLSGIENIITNLCDLVETYKQSTFEPESDSLSEDSNDED